MEDHPIPQNVTSFEFHLVGDMTLKQFGYLGTGLTIAFLSYMAIMPINALLGIFIIFVSASLGAGFAFLPLSDRPLDHWVKAFFRSAYAPTQGSWVPFNLPKGTKKVTVNPTDPIFKNRLQYYLSSIGVNIAPIEPAIPPAPKISPLPIKRLDQSQINKPAEKLPSAQELDKLVYMAQQAQILQAKVTEIERQISQLKNSIDSESPHTVGSQQSLEKKSPNLAYAQHFEQMVENLQGLVKQTENLHKQNEVIQKVVPRITPAHVVVIQTPKPTTAQLVLTSLPNVINGIITDTVGNYLEGVIVIIHNKEGIPVRALKTNKLGQFAGATPLPSGVYTVILEKDSLEFDTLQITLSGEILPTLTIRAKKGEIR